MHDRFATFSCRLKASARAAHLRTGAVGILHDSRVLTGQRQRDDPEMLGHADPGIDRLPSEISDILCYKPTVRC